MTSADANPLLPQGSERHSHNPCVVMTPREAAAPVRKPVCHLDKQFLDRQQLQLPPGMAQDFEYS